MTHFYLVTKAGTEIHRSEKFKTFGERDEAAQKHWSEIRDEGDVNIFWLDVDQFLDVEVGSFFPEDLNEG